jgi:hypothetical protein
MMEIAVRQTLNLFATRPRRLAGAYPIRLLHSQLFPGYVAAPNPFLDFVAVA